MPCAAVELHVQADSLGHWRAPYNLALMLESGFGEEVPKDLQRAGQMFNKFFKERSM